MDKLVIASNNKGKIAEIKEILNPFYREIVSLENMGLKLDVTEDGNTFQENAIKKAFEAMKISGCAALADDSGLEVEALGGRPGVYSARFAGEHASDEENNQKLLALMEGIPAEKRKAAFRCCIAICFPNGRILTAEGSCRGYIGFAPRGDQGFGYDPLFIVPEYGQTFAEIAPSIKNQISHRAKAFQALREKLMRKV
ncbi:MAG: XTP/dITP diphosphatase [Clostridia bacterium]|jgi:XTP/dITP diphosphohydrolase